MVVVEWMEAQSFKPNRRTEWNALRAGRDFRTWIQFWVSVLSELNLFVKELFREINLISLVYNPYNGYIVCSVIKIRKQVTKRICAKFIINQCL